MSEPLLVRACKREQVERTPVWFMRQAGRSLPEYRELRERHSFFEIADAPELCAEVTLQPVRRHDVDAAVLFADIVTPVIAMGAPVELVEGVGPVLDPPIRTAKAVEKLRVPYPEHAFASALEAIRLVRAELPAEKALVGFCGGPFTVACYLVEGRGSREFLRARELMLREPVVWHALLGRLSDAFAGYVAAQVAAGADVIQLFDSWAGILSPAAYEEFAAPYSARVLAAVEAPTIHFGTGTAGILSHLRDAGGDVIGLDWRVALDRGWAAARPRSRHPGQPRPGRAARPVGTCRASGSGRPRTSGGPPWTRFQPRSRRAARYRPGPADPACRARQGADGMSEVAVVLMAYGSPDRLEDVPAYYSDIRGGRPIRPELLDSLVERYRRLGIEDENPLNAITEETRARLEAELECPVFTGMKHWTPRIADAAERAVGSGATTVVGLVLAPHYSRGSIAGYREQLETSLDGRAELAFVDSWHDDPTLVAFLADRIRGTSAHVVFTAHSLPARILDGGDPYAEQLLETSQLVAEAAGVPEWSFSYQSESPTGEPWLQPDILEHLEALHAQGVRAVLVCPVGFVSDHLEIQWDLDVEAAGRAAELGMAFDRIDMPNADPAFVAVLAGVVRRMAALPSSP